MIECIRFYASMGWPVFPCSPKNKKPLTAHGFQDATCGLQQLEEWYKEHPGCAWGVATSAERAVLDVDVKHNGHLHLAKLIEEHGPLPLTLKVLTGAGAITTGCGSRLAQTAEALPRAIATPKQTALPLKQRVVM